MEMVKKNILSIICGVLALVAVVLWFWPLGAWQSEAEEKLKQRVAIHGSMQTLLNNTGRTLPALSVDSTEAQPLGMFPTPKAIEWAGGLKDKLSAEAKQVRAAAVALNERKPLMADVFPEPAPTMDYEFREKYIKAVTDLPKQMRMGPPPSGEEIDIAVDDLWTKQYEPRVHKRDGSPDPRSMEEQKSEYEKEKKLVPERIKQQRAKSLICYLEEDVILPNADIGEALSGTAPQPKPMWYAQLHYWIQSDVLGVIAEINKANSKQKCVIDAPVKYIRTFKIGDYRAEMRQAAPSAPMMAGPDTGSMGPTPEMLAQMQAAAMASAAAAQASLGGRPGANFGGGPSMGAPAGGVTLRLNTAGKLTGESPTGRKSNAIYDVIPFELVLDVEADRLPLVLAHLGRNTYITPYEVNVAAVDSVVTGLAENVVYGPAPVVRVTIYCETLMFRDWTAPLMPPVIKQALGVGTSEAAAPAEM